MPALCVHYMMSNFSVPAYPACPCLCVPCASVCVHAAVSVTIPSGALAERCQLRAYLLYTFWQSALIYPMIVHWVWSHEVCCRLSRPTAHPEHCFTAYREQEIIHKPEWQGMTKIAHNT